MLSFVKIAYHLCLRQSTGFLQSLFILLHLSELLVPDYTTLCRRQKSLSVALQRRLESGEKLVVGITNGVYPSKFSYFCIKKI